MNRIGRYVSVMQFSSSRAFYFCGASEQSNQFCSFFICYLVYKGTFSGGLGSGPVDAGSGNK